MKSVVVLRKKDEIGLAFDEALAIEPSALILFAAPSLFRDPQTLEVIKQKSAVVPCIGCSTAGEIAHCEASDDTLSMLALHFERGTRVRVAACPVTKAQNSYMAGETVGLDLKSDDLAAVFILAPGTNVNGTELAKGLQKAVGKDVIISGGLAGDGVDFAETHTLFEGGVFPDHAVAMGFYGDQIIVSCGSEGGWRPFGPARRVTRSEGHLLQELDNKPALQLYRQYLGEKARDLPASGLSYPFAILRDDRSMSGLIRSALAIDHDAETLIMAGDIPQGVQVCLMHADTDALIQGAAQAAAEALRTHAGPEEDGCAILVNFIGRRIVLGIDTDEEIEAVADSFLPGTTIAGYYSYGEISTHASTGRVELHNQTMTITYISERKDA